MKPEDQKSRPFHKILTVTYNLPFGRNTTLGKMNDFDKNEA